MTPAPVRSVVAVGVVLLRWDTAQRTTRHPFEPQLRPFLVVLPHLVGNAILNVVIDAKTYLHNRRMIFFYA